MRRFLVFLITFVVVLVAADFGLRFLSEYWVSQQMQRSLELSSRPSVSLGGFPYIPRLVSGDVPTVDVRTGTLTVQGVTLARVQLTLHEVHFSTKQLLYGKRADVLARSGEGVAAVKSIELTTVVAGRQANVHVRFEGSHGLLTTDLLPRPVEATVAVAGSSLVVKSNDPALSASFDVKLPELTPGLRYTSVVVADSEAVVAFVLSHPRFEV